MQLAAVTNEVAPLTAPGTLARILETAAEAGITTFEARTIEARRFPLLTSDAWSTLLDARDRLGIRYSASSPGTFIGVEVDSDLLALHRDHLWVMGMDLSEKLDCDTLITFAPRRSATPTPGEFDRVVAALAALADSAAARGFQVQLENLPGSWADTSDACLALLQAVNLKNFGYVWDTGNLYEAEGGAHFAAGLEKLRPYIRNVHLKDGSIIDGKMVWQHYGTGATDVAGQIAALKAIGYEGTIALEAARIPHIEGDFEASLSYLRTIL